MDQNSLMVNQGFIKVVTSTLKSMAQTNAMAMYFKRVNPSLENRKKFFSGVSVGGAVFSLEDSFLVNVISFPPGGFNILGFPGIFFDFLTQITNMNHNGIVCLIEIRLSPNTFVYIFCRKNLF